MINRITEVAKQINKYVEHGTLPKNQRFSLPNSPAYLKALGADDTEISLPVSVVKKAIEKHNLSAGEINRAIIRLYDPIFAFEKEEGENQKPSLLMVTDEFHYSNENYNPLVLSLNINDEIRIKHHTIEVQDVRTIFDKTLTAQDGTNLIDYWTKQGFCRYVDDKKISDWNTVSRNLFPIEVFQSDNNNILTKSVLVKESQKLNEFVVSPVKDLLNGREAPSISVSENIDHNVANKIKTDSKQIATNYVLEKLAAAGIEVVTKKSVFEELLNTSELLQKMTDNKPNVNVSDIYFTADKNEVLAFAKELDDFASQAKLGDKSINPLRIIKVGSISPVMKVLGIADVPVEIEQSTVLKALREEPLYPNDRQGHKLSLDELKAIPQSLADPVMVFRSDSPTRKTKDSFVFFTERKDTKGNSIIIPLAVNKKFGRLIINKVTSIYGKDDEVGYVKNNIRHGNLVYFDKKRSLEWERECKVQFLAQVLPTEGFINNIL